MKRFIALLAALIVFTGSAFAESIGTVDYDKLLRSYNKFVAFNDDAKIKQQNAEKMKAEFVKQLREAKTSQSNNPVAYDQLEKDLSKKYETEINSLRDWYQARATELDKELTLAIENVAKTKKLSTVVRGEVVLMGGQDITGDVLLQLNK